MWTALDRCSWVGAIASQVALEGKFAAATETLPPVTWLRSPELCAACALGFDALLADVYWIRAVQYYGDAEALDGEEEGIRPPPSAARHHHDTGPAIQHRVSVWRDPAVGGLSQRSRGPGPGDCVAPERHSRNARPVAVLPRRGVRRSTGGDTTIRPRRNGSSKQRSCRMHLGGSQPTAASMLARGGDRNSARALWTELATTSDQDWIRNSAKKALLQLDAEVVDRATRSLSCTTVLRCPRPVPGRLERARQRRVVERNPARPDRYAVRDRFGVRDCGRCARFATVPAAAPR